MFMFPIVGEGWIPCRYICWTRQLWSQVLNKHCLGSIYFYPYLWIRIISRVWIKGTKISASVDTDIFSDPDPGNKNIRICGYSYFLGSGSRERKYPYLWIRIFSRIRIQETKMSSDPSLQNYQSHGKCHLFYITFGGSKCKFYLFALFIRLMFSKINLRVKIGKLFSDFPPLILYRHNPGPPVLDQNPLCTLPILLR